MCGVEEKESEYETVKNMSRAQWEEPFLDSLPASLFSQLCSDRVSSYDACMLDVACIPSRGMHLCTKSSLFA